MINPFEKIKANLELAMVWLLVSPKNDIVIRLNLVYDSMLCEIVRLYCVCCVIYSGMSILPS